MKKAHGKGTLTITTEKKENNIRMSFKGWRPGITKKNLDVCLSHSSPTKDVGEGTGLGTGAVTLYCIGARRDIERWEWIRSWRHFHRWNTHYWIPTIRSKNCISTAKVEKLINEKRQDTGSLTDEPGVRALLEKVLTQSGHSVDTIDDGQQGTG